MEKGVFSDGHYLASGGADTTTLVWDLSEVFPNDKAVDAKGLETLWQDLGDDNSKVTYAAYCRAAAARDASVDCFKLQLKPSLPTEQSKIVALLRQLDANSFAQRQQASKALKALDLVAESSVRELLAKTESAEVKERLQAIVNGYERERRRVGYVIEILQMIGTPAAKGFLKELASGDEKSMVTRESRLTLDRMDKRP
jgi:hypothetical protein